MVILICCLAFFDPCLKLALSFCIHLFLNNAAHQGGKGGVLEQHGAICQPFLAPLHQLAHLQIRNGGELALNLGAVMLLVIPVIEVAFRHDARGQADKDQAPKPSPSA